jgi:drug/metabolite transporter (DMT)-like permease
MRPRDGIPIAGRRRTSRAERDQVVQSGVLLALASYAVYAWADAIIKGLGHSLSIYEIGVAYTAVSLVPMLLAKPAHERLRDTFRFRHRWLMPAILLLRVTSSVSVTYAFVTIPLAEAYCIIFLIPVFIAILSVVVLKEHVGIERWLLILVSFVGVLLVVRPGFRALEPGHLAALICAFADAGAAILTRFVSRDERRISMFVAPTLCSMALYVVMLLITGFKMPDLIELVMLVACGLCCGIAYVLYVTSFATAPASRVAPMLYSQIIWALVLGAAFFNEIPDGLALIGLAVIVVAGVGAVFADEARTRLAARTARRRSDLANDPPVPRPPEI